MLDKVFFAPEAAGPVAVLLTKLETARRDREAADKRRRDADRDIATMPLKRFDEEAQWRLR